MLGKKAPVVAIDIGTYNLKLVSLKETKKGYQLQNFGTISIPPGTIVEGTINEPEVVAQHLKNLIKLEKVKNKNAATSVCGTQVIIKKIQMPAMDKKELTEAVFREADQYIPSDIEDVNIDYAVVGKAQPEEGIDEEEFDQLDVLLVAVAKEKVHEYASVLRMAGLKPCILDLTAFALENAFELSYGKSGDETVALVDVGAGITNINIIHRGISTYTKDLYVGGLNFNEAIQQSLDVPFEVSEQLKLGNPVNGHSVTEVLDIINSVMEDLVVEIDRVLEEFRSSAEEEEEARIEKIYLCGGCSRMQGFSSYLHDQLGIPVEILNPFKNIRINYKMFDLEYINHMAPFGAVGVGLALRKFGDNI